MMPDQVSSDISMQNTNVTKDYWCQIEHLHSTDNRKEFVVLWSKAFSLKVDPFYVEIGQLEVKIFF